MKMNNHLHVDITKSCKILLSDYFNCTKKPASRAGFFNIIYYLNSLEK